MSVESSPIERILELLEGVKRVGRGWTARCPAHDDRQASLSIGQGEDERLLLHCHAGCETAAVVKACGLEMRDLFPTNDRAGVLAPDVKTARHHILNADGEVVAIHVRQDCNGVKRMFWERPRGQRGLGGLPVADLPLYGLLRLLRADPALPVIVLEGEKKADVLQGLAEGAAVVVGSVTGASGTPGDSALRPLLGRLVFLWPDFDGVGRSHMRRISAALVRLGATTPPRVIEWSGASVEGDDAADFVERGGTVEELHTLIETAKPFEPGAEEGIEPKPDSRPDIFAGEGDLGEILDAARKALAAWNDPPRLFRLGTAAVRVSENDGGTASLSPLGPDALREDMARSSRWFKKNDREGVYDAKAPLDVARVLLAGDLGFLPALVRIVRAPILAPSGRVVDRPGYDAETRTYYAPGPLRVPEIPEHPTEADVRVACDLLLGDLLCDFPFLGQADRANVLALYLLPFLREIIDGPTPLHLIEKPSVGSGASLLVEVLGQIIHGEPPPLMSEAKDEDEWRKRITSTLVGGPDLVAIDNLRRRLDSAALSTALTGRTWTDRRLGVTENIIVPVRCAWVATGNNPAVSSEIARRVVSIRIDPKVDRPWERKGFRHLKLLEWTRDNRPRLIAAALTLTRAWTVADRPEGSESIGSFERWAAVMGGVLKVAGVEGFLTNRERFYDRADRESAAWGGFISSWWVTHGEGRVGVKELWALLDESEVPFDLGRGSERSQRVRLGDALTRVIDRRFTLATAVVRVEDSGTVSGAAQYRLVLVRSTSDAPPEGECRESGESFSPPPDPHTRARAHMRDKDSQHSRDSRFEKAKELFAGGEV